MMVAWLKSHVGGGAPSKSSYGSGDHRSSTARLIVKRGCGKKVQPTTHRSSHRRARSMCRGARSHQRPPLRPPKRGPCRCLVRSARVSERLPLMGPFPHAWAHLRPEGRKPPREACLPWDENPPRRPGPP